MVNGTANWNTTQWNLIGRIDTSFGLEWGGNWTTIVDRPHFENMQGYNLAELRNLRTDGNNLPILE